MNSINLVLKVSNNLKSTKLILKIIIVLIISLQNMQADPPEYNPYDPFRDFNIDSIGSILPAVIRNCTENCDSTKFDSSFANQSWKPLCVINGQAKDSYIKIRGFSRLNKCFNPPSYEFTLEEISVDDNYKACKGIHWLDSAIVYYTQRMLLLNYKGRSRNIPLADVVGRCDKVDRGINVGCWTAINGNFVSYVEEINVTNNQVTSIPVTFTTKVKPCDSTCCVVKYAICRIPIDLQTGFLDYFDPSKRFKIYRISEANNNQESCTYQGNQSCMFMCNAFKDFPQYPFSDGINPNIYEILNQTAPSTGYRILNDFDNKKVEVYFGINSLKIFNISGENLRIENLYGNSKVISLHFLPKGAYFINIQKINGEIINEKIIID